MTGHIYVSRRLTTSAMRLLQETGAEVVVHPDPDWPPSREELLAAVRGAQAVVTLLTEKVDAELLEAAGRSLKIVANCAVGFDNIDVAAALERNVVVTNTPNVLDEATADCAFGLLLSTARRIVEADRFMRTGRKWTWGPRAFLGLDISAGTTLGIVGLGRIGMAMARRASAFNMRILATGRSAKSPEASDLGVVPVGFDELLRESDVVTLHCPLTPQTRHLIGPAELAAMKPTSILINTARGPIVDEKALVDALSEGAIAAAGLDVFENEPAVHPRLRQLENVVLLPHIASAGVATRDSMGRLAADNVRAVLTGEPPLTPVET